MANREFKIIRGGRLLSADFRRAEAADILVKGNRFEAITAPGVEAPSDAELIDASDRLLMPGLINAQTHGHGSLAKGYGDRWTLELLLNAGPWITANRTLEHKYLSVSLAAAEMIRKGCTSAYDLYVEVPLPSIEGMQAVGRGYRDAGFRALMAPMVADRSFFETVPALVDALPQRCKNGFVKTAWRRARAASRYAENSSRAGRSTVNESGSPSGRPFRCIAQTIN